MTDDDMPDLIRAELRLQAESVTATGALVEGAIAQARAIRRRHVVTAAIPLALSAVGVATVPTLLSQMSGANPSATTSPSSPTSTAATPMRTSDSLATTTAQPRLPIVQGSTLVASGRSVELPDGWAVTGMVWTGRLTIMDVTSNDRRFTATADAAGTVRELSNVAPPFAVSADGKFIAGLEPSTTVDSATPRSAALIVVELTTGTVVHRLTSSTSLFPERFLGTGTSSVLVSQYQGPPNIWSTADGRLSALDLSRNPDRLPLAVDSTGTLFTTADGEGHVSVERLGAKRPQWNSTTVADGPGAISPDNSMIALSSGDALVVLDTESGGKVSQSVSLGGQAPWRMTWEDPTTLIATDPAAVEGGLLRCQALTAECVKIVPSAAGAVAIENPPPPVVASPVATP